MLGYDELARDLLVSVVCRHENNSLQTQAGSGGVRRVGDEQLLEIGHWQNERYTQNVPRKVWQKILLEHGNTIIFDGRTRVLKAKYLGAGVYQIYKVPLKG